MKFRRFLGLGSQNVVGVDISSSSVKMVQLEPENSGYRMVAAGYEPISHSDLSEGTTAKHETIEAIRRCFSSGGFTTNQAVCSVSGPEVAVRFFEFPSMPADEIGSAVRLEAEQTCPIDIQQCTMDYVLLPPQHGDDPTDESTGTRSAKTRGVMVTATNKVIQKRKEIVEAAYLRCVMMDVDSLAMLAPVLLALFLIGAYWSEQIELKTLQQKLQRYQRSQQERGELASFLTASDQERDRLEVKRRLYREKIPSGSWKKMGKPTELVEVVGCQYTLKIWAVGPTGAAGNEAIQTFLQTLRQRSPQSLGRDEVRLVSHQTDREGQGNWIRYEIDWVFPPSMEEPQ